MRAGKAGGRQGGRDGREGRGDGRGQRRGTKEREGDRGRQGGREVERVDCGFSRVLNFRSGEERGDVYKGFVEKNTKTIKKY